MRAGEWHPITNVDLPLPVFARFGTADNGRLVCTGLMLGDGSSEVTSRALRQVPLAAIVEDFAERQAATHDGVQGRPARAGPQRARDMGLLGEPTPGKPGEGSL